MGAHKRTDIGFVLNHTYDLIRHNESRRAAQYLMRIVEHKGALDNVLFSDADLSRSKWSECSMECINFMDTKLEQSLFRESELHNVFFIRAKLSGALFDYSRFTNVIFASASLDDALFNMDEDHVPEFIRTCNFENADLRGCLVNKTLITELIEKYKGK
jgi:uncharacterized protein YjbI with pentapeptide repeats